MSKRAQIRPHLLKFASVSGWWCRRRRWSSAQPLQVEVRAGQAHHPLPTPAEHRGTLPPERPCTELRLHSSVVFMLFIQKTEELDASNLLPESSVLFQ